MIYLDLPFPQYIRYFSAFIFFFEEKKNIKNMFNLDEEKTECALGNKKLCFWQGKKAENVVFLFLASGLYLSLTLGTAKFKQLD